MSTIDVDLIWKSVEYRTFLSLPVMLPEVLPGTSSRCLLKGGDGLSQRLILYCTTDFLCMMTTFISSRQQAWAALTRSWAQ